MKKDFYSTYSQVHGLFVAVALVPVKYQSWLFLKRPSHLGSVATNSYSTGENPGNGMRPRFRTCLQEALRAVSDPNYSGDKGEQVFLCGSMF